MLAVVAAFLAGCSENAVRVPGASLFAANNSADSTSGTPIESRDLGPLNSASSLAPSPITTPASLSRRGWSVEGAPIVEVSQGDSAASLSQGFNVPVDVILAANGLSSPSDIRPGSRVIIPTYVRVDQPNTTPSLGPASIPGTALAADDTLQQTQSNATQQVASLGAPPTTLNAQAANLTYTVQPGDTLYSIARKYNTSHSAVASANGMAPDAYVRSGQVLRIPGPGGTTGTQVAAATDTDPTTTDAAPQTTAQQPTQVAAATTQPVSQPPAAAAATSQPATPAPSTQASGFRWPLRGAILVGFGSQADGQRNDGINLAAPAGTPVHAADNGKVIYAGNELEGYGNLVLIQHENDWVSAYAHNSELKVSRGDVVKRGQTIAAVGNTGSVDQPQLHFELRRSSTPVDPLPHLSSGA